MSTFDPLTQREPVHESDNGHDIPGYRAGAVPLRAAPAAAQAPVAAPRVPIAAPVPAPRPSIPVTPAVPGVERPPSQSRSTWDKEAVIELHEVHKAFGSLKVL